MKKKYLILTLIFLLSLVSFSAVIAEEAEDTAKWDKDIPTNVYGRVLFDSATSARYKGDSSGVERVTSSYTKNAKNMFIHADANSFWEIENARKANFESSGVYTTMDFGKQTDVNRVYIGYPTMSNHLSGTSPYTATYDYANTPKIIRIEASNNGVNYAPVIPLNNGDEANIVTDFTTLHTTKPVEKTEAEYLESIRTSEPEKFKAMTERWVEFPQNTNLRYLRLVILQPTQDWLYTTGDTNTTTKGQIAYFHPYIDHTDAQKTIAEMSPLVPEAGGKYTFTVDRISYPEVFRANTNRPLTFWVKSGFSIPSPIGDILQSGGFELSAVKQNYIDEDVFLQYDFGVNSRVDKFSLNFANNAGSSGTYRVKYNFVPKKFRIDSGVKNASGKTIWTPVKTVNNDLSRSADVGEVAANAYNAVKEYTKDLTDDAIKAILSKTAAARTQAEDRFINNVFTIPTTIDINFDTPVDARFFKIVILEPNQLNYTVDSDNGNNLPAKDAMGGYRFYYPTFYNTAADAALLENTIAENGMEIPRIYKDGRIDFIKGSANSSVLLNGENFEGRTNYRVTAAPRGSIANHYNMFAEDTGKIDFKFAEADYILGNAYVQLDLGKRADVNALDVKFFTSAPTLQAIAVNRTAVKKMRLDYANLDEYGRPVWRQGPVLSYDLSNADDVGVGISSAYNLLKNLTDAQITAIKAIAAEERDEYQSSVAAAAALTLPVTQKYYFDNISARLFRFVILENSHLDFKSFTTNTAGTLAGTSMANNLNVTNGQPVNLFLRNTNNALITNDWSSEQKRDNVHVSGMFNKGGASRFTADGNNYTGSDSAERLFDGSTTANGWNGDNQFFAEYRAEGMERYKETPWIVIDLERPYLINDYKIFSASANYRVKDYKLQAIEDKFDDFTGEDKAAIVTDMVDPEHYTTKVTVTDAQSSQLATNSFEHHNSNFTPFVARYIRIQLDAPNQLADQKAILAELMFKGTPYTGEAEEWLTVPESLDPASVEMTKIVIENKTTGKDISLSTIQSGEIRISAKIKNNSGDSKSALLIATLYNKAAGKIEGVNLDASSKLITAGAEETVSATIDVPTDVNLNNYEIRIFTWSDSSKMLPITRMMTFDSNGASNQ